MDTDFYDNLDTFFEVVFQTAPPALSPEYPFAKVKVWKQLEPVFESDDIGKTLANEASMFKDVDALWR